MNTEERKINRRKKEAFRFFTKNLIQGLIWFLVIGAVLWLGIKYLPSDFKELLTPLREKELLVYSIFFASEVIFGIIPPEIFMVWALDRGLMHYIEVIALLTVISYLGGIIAYFIGRYFSNTRLFRKFKNSESYYKYSRTYRRFGGIVILISAVTPLPFALISMISGSFSYRFYWYIRFAAFRVLRFAVYGYFIWEGMRITF